MMSWPSYERLIYVQFKLRVFSGDILSLSKELWVFQQYIPQMLRQTARKIKKFFFSLKWNSITLILLELLKILESFNSSAENSIWDLQSCCNSFSLITCRTVGTYFLIKPDSTKYICTQNSFPSFKLMKICGNY